MNNLIELTGRILDFFFLIAVIIIWIRLNNVEKHFTNLFKFWHNEGDKFA
jgi:hypothetical protein